MNKVKISSEKPPQWILDEVKEKFDVEWENGVIFTYGDLITNCFGEISEDLMHHEPHHTKQQEEFGGADKWWRRYLDDEQFRFEQELECYRKQYNWVKNNIKSRDEVFFYLKHYASSLSGKMYGGIVDFSTALNKIKQ